MHVHEEWLYYALCDLKAAHRLIGDDEDPLIFPSLVLMQQAAEKALKGYLIFKLSSSIKTHDLVKLVERCIALDDEFNTVMPIAVDLNPHVSSSRYPDAFLFEPDLTTARVLMQKTKIIVDFVCSKFD